MTTYLRFLCITHLKIQLRLHKKMCFFVYRIMELTRFKSKIMFLFYCSISISVLFLFLFYSYFCSISILFLFYFYFYVCSISVLFLFLFYFYCCSISISVLFLFLFYFYFCSISVLQRLKPSIYCINYIKNSCNSNPIMLTLLYMYLSFPRM